MESPVGFIFFSSQVFLLLSISTIISLSMNFFFFSLPLYFLTVLILISYIGEN
ncbi:hypothetical protein GGR53DRAFT_488055 [Hypoxylon sp. FL1150]|nr:hypothetical protein GGR53DRAFT_488055 [Hypoxylon sp. FL1150]